MSGVLLCTSLHDGNTSQQGSSAWAGQLPSTVGSPIAVKGDGAARVCMRVRDGNADEDRFLESTAVMAGRGCAVSGEAAGWVELSRARLRIHKHQVSVLGPGCPSRLRRKSRELSKVRPRGEGVGMRHFRAWLSHACVAGESSRG